MSGPALYTLVVDYKGGTYISQVEASDADAALSVWCRTFAEETDIPADIRPLAHTVAEDIADVSPPLTPLAGLKNVWCETALHDGGLAIINIVKTMAI